MPKDLTPGHLPIEQQCSHVPLWPLVIPKTESSRMVNGVSLGLSGLVSQEMLSMKTVMRAKEMRTTEFGPIDFQDTGY